MRAQGAPPSGPSAPPKLPLAPVTMPPNCAPLAAISMSSDDHI